MIRLAKKFFLILLSVLLAISAFWGCFSVTAASNLLFKDDFSTGLTGWTSTNVGGVSGGAYVMQGTEYNMVTGKQSADQTGIVADVKVARVTNPATQLPYGNGTASITFHSQANGSVYYEFGLGVSQNGAAYAFLCLNRANGESPVLKKQSTKIPGAANGIIQENKAYTLKVLLYDGKIYCYINDMLFCEATDNLKTGAMGVAAWNAKATIDDFAVYNLGEKEITSIEVLNAPTQLVYGEELGIQVQVNYSGLYGSGILSEDAVGLNITGYNGVGKKKITATYGGKSDSFTVNILPAKGVTTVFDAGSFSANDWEITNNDYSNIGITYEAKLGSGKLYAEFPKAGAFNSPLVTKAMVQKDLTNLQNYAITAVGKVTKDSTTATVRRGAVDIYFAQNNTTLGYRIESDGAITLYNGSTALAYAKTTLALGQEFTVKVEVVAGIATLTINGTVVASYDFGQTTPLFGVRLLNGSAEINSYKVVDLGKHSKWNAKSIQLVDADGNIVEKIVSRGLNLSALSLWVTYFDGAVVKMAVTDGMIRGYNANSTEKQTVSVVYGNASDKFTYEYTKYLYKATFDNSNLSTFKITNPERYEWSVKSGKLYANLDKITKESKTISSLATLQIGKHKNLSISADVAFLETNDYDVSTIALQLRKNGSYGYELAYNYRLSGGAYLELICRSESGGTRSMSKWVQSAIIDAMGVDIYDKSTIINLRLEVVGRTVSVFANNKLLGALYDDSEYAVLQEGDAVIKVLNARATIDNILVEELPDRQVKKIEVLGTQDGIIQLYRGFELENGQYNINVTYDDGTSIQIPLKTEYLSQYADLPVGLNEVVVNYQGVQTYIKIRVSERPEYVAAFEAKVKALDPKKLTLDDKSTVAELKKEFDTLSPWEIKNLPESLYKQYKDIIEAMDRLRMPEIEGSDLLYYNDFSTSGIDTKEWDVKYVSQVGQWFIRNGYMINEQHAYGVSGTSWAYLNPIYGDISAFEADLCMAKDGAFASLVINITDKGYYHSRITNKYTDEEGRVTIMVQLYKCIGTTQYKIQEVYTQLYNLDMRSMKS